MQDVYGNCSSCYPNYILSKGVCLACNFVGCNLTNSSIVNGVCTCGSCISGYYLSGLVCLPCTVPNCSICTVTTCTACKQNYYLSSNTCLNSTAANCLQSKTNSSVLCNICVAGYYLGVDLTCYLCQTNCLECTTRSNCLKCNNVSILQGGYCLTYPSNCLEINGTNTNFCLLCAHGYYLTNGVCLPCDVQLGTLTLCNGLCPIDEQIQAIMVQVIVAQHHLYLNACLSILVVFLAIY